jgi:hypothetical protein
MLSSAALILIGCGSDSRGGSFPTYIIRTLPLDNGVLTLGFNQIFSIELTAQQDMIVDALVIDILASAPVDIAGVEMRDETTQTIGNSVLRFPFRPVYPLRLQIPANQFVPAGKKKVFVIYADVISFGRANNLQVTLLDILATTPGNVILPPLGAPILGPPKVSNA